MGYERIKCYACSNEIMVEFGANFGPSEKEICRDCYQKKDEWLLDFYLKHLRKEIEDMTSEELYKEQIENPKVTDDDIIYPSIGGDYHNIGGLKIYFSCENEALKREYANKIKDLLMELEGDKFTLHHIILEKPKIHDKKLYAVWSETIYGE